MKAVAEVLHLCTSTIDYMSSFIAPWVLLCLVTKSLIDSSFWIQYIDFSMFVDRFVIIVPWISLSCYMDLSKLQYGFAKVVTWICQSSSIYFSPSAKQNQAEIWPRIQSWLKLLLWLSWHLFIQSTRFHGSIVPLAMFSFPAILEFSAILNINSGHSVIIK